MDTTILHNLEIASNSVKHTLERIEKSQNVAVAILLSDFLDEWHELNNAFLEFAKHVDVNSIVDLLDAKNFTKIYDEMKSRYSNILKTQLHVFEIRNHYRYHMLMEKIKDSLFTLKYPVNLSPQLYNDLIRNSSKEVPLYDNTEPELFEEESPISSKLEYKEFSFEEMGITLIYQSLERIAKTWKILSSYIEEIYQLKWFEYSVVKEAIVKHLRNYSKDNRYSVTKQLSLATKNLKENRCIDPTPEIWGLIMKEEDRLIDLAINGKLQEESNSFLSFSNNMVKKMEDNPILLKEILSNSVDGALFNLDDAIAVQSVLKSCLNKNNLEVFEALVLRRNLIQCEMFPNLKTEYEAWLRQGLQKDNISTDGSLSSKKKYELSILPDNIRHLFLNPDKFDAYCRVLNGDIKTFIDGQGSKAIWDVVNFYSMLYGFFPKNISRENAAGIFMSIVPELKAEKPLSMMRKCNFTDKKKLKNYATLPATDGLKAYEENIGKWIKEIAQSEESSQ